MDNSTGNQKLRFRIVECSGEDPQHPVSELLSGSPQSNGWHSQRFCSFPQFITFQFLTPVQLKQLQFLSHESKIASRLELFTAMSDAKSHFSSLDMKFKKLGYLSLDQNDKSGYQLRELKTVYIDAPCVYLRVVFEKCHPNKFNFFHQVGLIAIAAFGEPLNAVPMTPARSLNQSLHERHHKPEKQERIESNISVDDLVTKKIRELEDDKARAIENEEFEEAHRIKNELGKAKQIASQVYRFEERKAVALQNEDFETANTLKREIERLKEAISMIGGPLKNKHHHHVRDEKSLATEQGSQKGSLPDLPEPRSKNQRNSVKGAGQGRNSHLRSLEEDDEDEEGKRDREYYEDEEEYMEDYEDEEEYEGGNSRRVKNYDDQIIPALKKKNNDTIDQEEYSQLNLPQEPENIASAYQKLAEPIIPIIGEDLCKRVFSKHWNLREDALKQLLIEFAKGGGSNRIDFTEPSNTFFAILAVVSVTIVDRINQISTKAMTLLKQLMTQKSLQNSTKLDISVILDKITNAILEKVGDNSAKIREQAEDTFLSMAKNPIITCSYCVQSICRLKAKKGRNGLPVKQILGRLRLLQMIIKEFRINNPDVSYNTVMDYILDKIEHPNLDVRTTTTALMVEIYKLVGDKVRVHLDDLSLAARETLEKEFDIVMPSNKGSSTKIPRKGKNTVSPQQQNKKSENEEKSKSKGSENKKGDGKTPGKTTKADGNQAAPNKIKTESLPSVNGAKNQNSPGSNSNKAEKGKSEALPSVNGAKAISGLAAIAGGAGKKEGEDSTRQKTEKENGKTPGRSPGREVEHGDKPDSVSPPKNSKKVAEENGEKKDKSEKKSNEEKKSNFPMHESPQTKSAKAK